MAFASEKVKAGIWVQVQVRLCAINGLGVYVARKGDPDAGAVLLKLNRMGEGCEVLTQVRTMEGKSAWMRAVGGGLVPEDRADAYIRGQIDFDPDLWVLEIEDPGRKYQVDGEIV